MAIDASIYSAANRPTTQLESPVDMTMKALAMRNAIRQGETLDREDRERNSMTDIFKKSTITDPSGKPTLDKGMAISELYKVNPQKAMEFQKYLQSQDLDTLKRNTEASKTLAWSATPENWAQIRQKGIEMGLPNMEKLPEQYVDSVAKNWKIGTLEGEKQIEQMWKEREMGLRQQELGVKREELKANREKVQSEKEYSLQTPFGLANTVDDAKKLKEGYEAKKNFDNKLDQMIALRTEKGGGAIMDREAVARGKQLSKDLLLEYKNMAKLGVLSKSDEDIINAIIPEDPLQYNSPLASIQGQDPTIKRLESFKADSDKDFQTRIQTRTRNPQGPAGTLDLNKASDADIAALYKQMGGK